MKRIHNSMNGWLREVDDLLGAAPTHVDIATYRIGSTPQLVEQLSALGVGRKVRILIGYSNESDVCFGIAEELVDKGQVQVRTLRDCHAKCWIFRYKHRQPVCLLGGRNLNFSTWPDFTVRLGASYAEELLPMFNTLWATGANVVVSDWAKEILKEQKERKF